MTAAGKKAVFSVLKSCDKIKVILYRFLELNQGMKRKFEHFLRLTISYIGITQEKYQTLKNA